MNQRQLVRLEQGSEAWYQYRLLHRNASETAAVMGLCPWTTAYQLWEVKTGRRRQDVTYPMQRGIELEPAARKAYEERTGNIVEPAVIESGEYSASLDGLTFDAGLVLEIKCPLHGKDSALWSTASEGKVPEHYELQVQHQLLVSGAGHCDFWVYDGKGEGLVVRLLPDASQQHKLQSAWDEYWEHIVKDSPPALSERDCVIRQDAEWGEAARTYLAAKTYADAACVSAEEAKSRLVALATHNSERGCGVSVSRFWRAKAAKEEVRVTVLKEEA